MEMFHGHRATTKRRVDKIFAKHRIRLDMYGADESCKASSTKNDCDHKCHFETYTTDNNGEHQDPKDNKEYFRKKVSFEPEVKVYENCCVAQAIVLECGFIFFRIVCNESMTSSSRVCDLFKRMISRSLRCLI